MPSSGWLVVSLLGPTEEFSIGIAKLMVYFATHSSRSPKLA
jgi:hypothetical protein